MVEKYRHILKVVGIVLAILLGLWLIQDYLDTQEKRKSERVYDFCKDILPRGSDDDVNWCIDKAFATFYPN